MARPYRHRRSANPANPFPNPLEPGELAVNTANRQIALGDAAAGVVGAPLPMLAVRFWDVRASYAINDFVLNGGTIYRANMAIPPGAFVESNWTKASATGGDFVPTGGGTMTGPLNIQTGDQSPLVYMGTSNATSFYIWQDETFNWMEIGTESYGNTPEHNHLTAYAARGTWALPSALQVGDTIHSVDYMGMDAASVFAVNARIRAIVDAAPTNDGCPTAIAFNTGGIGDNSIERLRIGSDGKVHAIPPGGGQNDQGFVISHYGGPHTFVQLTSFNNDRYSEGIYFQYAAGTADAPLAVEQGSEILGPTWAGFDGANTQTTTSINGIVEGPVSVGNVPIALQFKTGTANYGTERMRIGSDGTVSVGQSASGNGDWINAFRVRNDSAVWGLGGDPGASLYLEFDCFSGSQDFGPWEYISMGRGTFAAPLPVQPGDKLWGMSFTGRHAGGDWAVPSAQMEAQVDGPVTTEVPTALVFKTGLGVPGTDGGIERLRIASDGSIYFRPPGGAGDQGIGIFHYPGHTFLSMIDYNDEAWSEGVYYSYARGTQAAPAAVQLHDEIGFSGYSGHTGAAWQTTVTTSVMVDGVVTSDPAYVPAAFCIATRPNATGRVERFRVESSGKVLLSNPVPIVDANQVPTKAYVDSVASGGGGGGLPLTGGTLTGPLHINTTVPSVLTAGSAPAKVFIWQAPAANGTIEIGTESYGTQSGAFTFYYGRGTAAAPAPAQAGDIIGRVGFQAYDAALNTWQNAFIQGVVDGTPDANGAPTALRFSTGSGETTEERLRISSGGLSVFSSDVVAPNIHSMSGGLVKFTLSMAWEDAGRWYWSLDRYDAGGSPVDSPIIVEQDTGLLQIKGPPTIGTHAANKAYVDSVATGGGLPLTGGTLTGVLGIEPATGAAMLNINPLQAGQQGIITFFQTGAAKWVVGKHVDDSFIFYDGVSANTAMQLPAGGGSVSINRKLSLTRGISTGTDQTYNGPEGWNYFGSNVGGVLPAHVVGLAIGWNGSGGGGEVNFVSNADGGSGVQDFVFQKWNGTVLTTLISINSAGITLPADPTANLQAATKQYADLKLPKTGGTISGNLLINKFNPTLYLDKQNSTEISQVIGRMAGGMRWTMKLGDETAESGAVGSDFALIAHGGASVTAIAIARSTGLVVLAADPTAALGAATKQYVDGRIATRAPLATISTGAPSGGVDGDVWYQVV